MSVKVDIIGEEQIFNMLSDLPTAVQDTAADDANKYLLNVLRTNPPYRYVPRRQAYPEVQGWFSDKQRRFVMAKIGDGSINIPYRRTGDVQRAWKKRGSGQNATIVNESPAAVFLMDDERQARQPRLVGWQKVSQIMSDHREKLLKVLDGSIKKAMKKAGAK